MEPCRVCGHVVDAHTNAYDVEADLTPDDGDASICFYCGTLSAFKDGVPVEPTEEQRAIYLANQQVVNVIALIKLQHAKQ